MNTLFNNQKGVALIVVFLIMTVFSAAVLSISVILLNEIKIIGSNSDSMKSFYAAQSSLERTFYLDRKQIPAGGARGLCNICASATDLTSCTYTNLAQGGADGCDVNTCNNCQVTFTSGFDNQTYSTTASVIPDPLDSAKSLLTINTNGYYKNVVRRLSITGSSEAAPTSTTNLRIVKNTTGGNGTFTYSVTGTGSFNPSVTTTSGTGSTTTAATAGTYNIIETAQNGWAFNSASCDGSNQSTLTMTKNPNTAANDNSIGTQSWSNTNNALTDNGSYATVAINGIGQSNYLKATNFGFNIPGNATINGIQVEWKKGILSENGGADNSVRIVRAGTITGDEKSTGQQWPMLGLNYVSYGGASDLWGLGWVPTDINASNFGAVISGKRTINQRGSTFSVDTIRITVTYTVPAANGTQTANGINNVTVVSGQTTTCTFSNTAVSNPAPTTTSISPSSAFVGDSGFTLTVNGTNFVGSSIVKWNGVSKTTTYISPTQLTAAIPSSDLLGAGSYSVTVTNPAPGGGTSNAQTFTVNTSNDLGGKYVYIIDNTSSVLQKLNESNLSLVRQTTVPGSAPQDGLLDVAVSPDGNYLYLTHYGTLLKLTSSTLTTVAQTTTGLGANSIAVSPDGSFVYVGNAVSNTIQKFNTSNLSLAATGNTGTGPVAIALAPNNAFIYAVNSSSNTIQKFNTTDLSLVRQGNTGSAPVAVAVAPNSSTVYASNQASNTIQKFNVVNLNPTGQGNTGTQPNSIAVSPDGNFVYVANQSTTLQKFNTSDLSLATQVTVGTLMDVAVSTNGTYVYVLDSNSHTVKKYNSSNLSLAATGTTGNSPEAVAVSP